MPAAMIPVRSREGSGPPATTSFCGGDGGRGTVGLMTGTVGAGVRTAPRKARSGDARTVARRANGRGSPARPAPPGRVVEGRPGRRTWGEPSGRTTRCRGDRSRTRPLRMRCAQGDEVGREPGEGGGTEGPRGRWQGELLAGHPEDDRALGETGQGLAGPQQQAVGGEQALGPQGHEVPVDRDRPGEDLARGQIAADDLDRDRPAGDGVGGPEGTGDDRVGAGDLVGADALREPGRDERGADGGEAGGHGRRIGWSLRRVLGEQRPHQGGEVGRGAIGQGGEVGGRRGGPGRPRCRCPRRAACRRGTRRAGRPGRRGRRGRRPRRPTPRGRHRRTTAAAGPTPRRPGSR